ncbi:MAG: hypothetical protein ACI8RZ_001685, partial [Myxococcota bacterium]
SMCSDRPAPGVEDEPIPRRGWDEIAPIPLPRCRQRSPRPADMAHSETHRRLPRAAARTHHTAGRDAGTAAPRRRTAPGRLDPLQAGVVARGKRRVVHDRGLDHTTGMKAVQTTEGVSPPTDHCIADDLPVALQRGHERPELSLSPLMVCFRPKGPVKLVHGAEGVRCLGRSVTPDHAIR